jgi:hypothetical protein
MSHSLSTVTNGWVENNTKMFVQTNSDEAEDYTRRTGRYRIAIENKILLPVEGAKSTACLHDMTRSHRFSVWIPLIIIIIIIIISKYIALQQRL